MPLFFTFTLPPSPSPSLTHTHAHTHTHTHTHTCTHKHTRTHTHTHTHTHKHTHTHTSPGCSGLHDSLVLELPAWQCCQWKCMVVEYDCLGSVRTSRVTVEPGRASNTLSGCWTIWGGEGPVGKRYGVCVCCVQGGFQ